jgi:hypothetical protein
VRVKPEPHEPKVPGPFRKARVLSLNENLLRTPGSTGPPEIPLPSTPRAMTWRPSASAWLFQPEPEVVLGSRPPATRLAPWRLSNPPPYP